MSAGLFQTQHSPHPAFLQTVHMLYWALLVGANAICHIQALIIVTQVNYSYICTGFCGILATLH